MTITCYEGACGPTIRLGAKTADELRSVYRIVWSLSVGNVVQEDLCKALVCDSDAIQSLIVESRPERPAKVVELRGNGSEGPIFCWANTAEGWLELAERLDAIMLVGIPGPRYLTREGIDDAVVELCYRE